MQPLFQSQKGENLVCYISTDAGQSRLHAFSGVAVLLPDEPQWVAELRTLD
jgi:hypothetical protein